MVNPLGFVTNPLQIHYKSKWITLVMMLLYLRINMIILIPGAL